MEKTILSYDTVALDEAGAALVIIDQTKLPNEFAQLRLTEQPEIWDAIYRLKVRGAPAIGVAAAYGAYLAARAIDTDDYETFAGAFKKACDYLNSSRPTAVNLSWALARMMRAAEAEKSHGVAAVKARLLAEARAIQQEDIDWAAQCAVGLDKLVENNNLSAMAYYYEGLNNIYERVASNLIVGNSLLVSRGVALAGEGDMKTCMAM